MIAGEPSLSTTSPATCKSRARGCAYKYDGKMVAKKEKRKMVAKKEKRKMVAKAPGHIAC
jgi:hypothetical protein